MKVITDFNSTGLERLISNTARDIKIDPLPYGQPMQAIFHCIENSYDDLVVLWLSASSISPSFSQVLNFADFDRAALDRELDEFLAMVTKLAQRSAGVICVNFVMPPHMQGSGLANLLPGNPGFILAEMNLKLYNHMAQLGNGWCLDQNRWFHSDSYYVGKLYHAGKIPFSQNVFRSAAEDIVASSLAIRGQSRKLLVLDLDDTLWGGILGDDGVENLKLGSPGAVGEAYAQFQREIKALKNRGIALAIASKNYEQNAIDAIKNHPEMQLCISDFSAWRINWDDKAANIAEIAAELNIGLQSVVFIDDNPAERGRVSEALPEVLVPQWPDDPSEYVEALRKLTCFSVASLTQEDRAKTQMFLEEKQRTALKSSVTDRDSWLQSMEMRLSIETLTPSNSDRIVQLLNKTNQFNLRTRRLTEAELTQWLADGNELVAFRVADRFGDMGLTGLVGLMKNGSVVELTDFVLSCRVMGRNVEQAMLATALQYARSAGARSLRLTYQQTPKNRPIFDFLASFGLISEHNFETEIPVDSMQFNTAMFTVEDHRG